MKTNSTPAWRPLSPNDWNREKARHLASRLGFSVHPSIVDAFEGLGPNGVVENYLLQPQLMEPSTSLREMREAMNEMNPRSDKDALREKRRELQRQNRESYADYAVDWYRFASNPKIAPQEKLCLFFQNVWVVAYQGVKRAPDLFEYQNKIRSNLAGSYPQLCYELTLTAAMGRYLDLGKNKAGAPNENFSRELFELFTLGEGNYSEQDIKETARALTGYTFRPNGEVLFRPRAHDDGVKVVFGKRGRFRLEDILELTFKQPAAATFLPSEFLRYYLSDQEIAPAIVDELGRLWRNSGYSLPFLYRTVFNSELFYSEEYRANLIKSPVHFYLGLHQDFEIAVIPLARECHRSGRSMGQTFFNPPNVKGWEGGRAWINSATLAARRQVAINLFRQLKTDRLNADDLRALEKDKELHPDVEYRINVETFFAKRSKSEPEAQFIAERLFAETDSSLLEAVARKLEPTDKPLSGKDKRELLQAALNSPSYQLC